MAFIPVRPYVVDDPLAAAAAAFVQENRPSGNYSGSNNKPAPTYATESDKLGTQATIANTSISYSLDKSMQSFMNNPIAGLAGGVKGFLIRGLGVDYNKEAAMDSLLTSLGVGGNSVSSESSQAEANSAAVDNTAKTNDAQAAAASGYGYSTSYGE